MALSNFAGWSEEVSTEITSACGAGEMTPEEQAAGCGASDKSDEEKSDDDSDK